MKINTYFLLVGIFCTCMAFSQEDKPAQSAADLAKKLSNPIASLITVPFQNNTDVGIGIYNGSRNTLNFQPVISISLSPSLNVITRVVQELVETLKSHKTGKEMQQPFILIQR